MPETLIGFIERVTYHNPENGFAVLRVKVKGRDDLVSVIGSTTSVTAGEHVEASGCWAIDRQHGQQFKADELKTTHPASAEGIERYLASGAIRSIGPKIAERIVAAYKERSLEIFEKHPGMLLHIKGTHNNCRLRQWRKSGHSETNGPLYRQEMSRSTRRDCRFSCWLDTYVRHDCSLVKLRNLSATNYQRKVDMGRGLSNNQQSIIRLAMKNRDEGRRSFNNVDLYHHEILVRHLGWELQKPVHIESTDHNTLSDRGQRFDRRAIGEEKYYSAMASLLSPIY